MIDLGFFKKNEHLLWQKVPAFYSQIDLLNQKIQLAEHQRRIFDDKIRLALIDPNFAKENFPAVCKRIQDYFKFKAAVEGMSIQLCDLSSKYPDKRPAQKKSYRHMVQTYQNALIGLEKKQQCLSSHFWMYAPEGTSNHHFAALKIDLKQAHQDFIDAKKLASSGYQHGMNQLAFYWQIYTQLCLIFASLSFVMLYVYIGVQTSASLILLIMANLASVACLVKLYQTHLSHEQLNQAYKALP